MEWRQVEALGFAGEVGRMVICIFGNTIVKAGKEDEDRGRTTRPKTAR